MPSSTTMTAAAFIDSLGVDTHVSTGANGYGNTTNVLSDLKYLGISNIRDGDNGSLTALITMAQAGIKFDFLMAGGGSMVTADLQAEFAVIDQVAQAVPGSVAAVEGANEINNFPITYNGAGGSQGAINMQQAIYSMTHSDPNLAGTSVYYFTGYGFGSGPNPDPATTAGLADYDNQHPYPQNGSPPLDYVNRTTALSNENPTTGPAVYTETGYSNTGTFGANLGLTGQAKYTLDLLLDDAHSGVARTYLYELLEEGDGFGLFTTAGTPTPAATAIHNLTSILADNGSVSASAQPAGFTLSGLPSHGYELTLLKSTGATDIIVWAEPQITGNTSGPASTVTVSLAQTYSHVALYDPLSGTTPIQSLSNVSSVQLSVTDHPLIVEVDPSGTGSTPTPTSTPSPVSTPTPTPAPAPTSTPSPAPTPTAAPTTVAGPVTGSGSDTLVLSISEDSYQGDAQFTVAVDGKQLGGAFTATASHGAGDTETFTFHADLGAGQHTVAVDFLNDLYAGTPSTDRNLYVDAISADGTNANQAAALMSSGTHDFTVAIASPSGATSTPAPSPAPADPATTVTVPSGQFSVFEQVSNTLIQATSGDHVVSLSGTNDTVNLTGGNETVLAFQGDNAITTGTGNDSVQIGGSGNVVNLGAGQNQLFDRGSGNTIVSPAAGAGMDTVSGAVLQNGDRLDFRAALQSTGWDGSTATLGDFLHISNQGGNAVVGISPTSNGSMASVIDLRGAAQISLTTLLAHSLV